MKKLILTVLIVMGMSVPVFAEPIHNTGGAKLDAPKLIGLKQINKDLFLGIEASKPLATNLFYPDSFAWNEDDKAYEVMVKITFDGCVFNCP